MQDPNEYTEWNDILRSKGILPSKEKELTEEEVVKVVESVVEVKQSKDNVIAEVLVDPECMFQTATNVTVTSCAASEEAGCSQAAAVIFPANTAEIDDMASVAADLDWGDFSSKILKTPKSIAIQTGRNTGRLKQQSSLSPASASGQCMLSWTGERRQVAALQQELQLKEHEAREAREKELHELTLKALQAKEERENALHELPLKNLALEIELKEK